MEYDTIVQSIYG
uniref:Uncharacterized protein n=1 Tax=Anguilla anguilla TaxID=7936 RepID=A0A0E9R192_ANGAN